MPRDRQKAGGERIGKPGERGLTGWRSAGWNGNEDWEYEWFRHPGVGGTCVLYREGQGGWNGKEGGRWRGTQRGQRPKGPVGPKWGGQLRCFGGRKVGWGGASSAGCGPAGCPCRNVNTHASLPHPQRTAASPPGKIPVPVPSNPIATFRAPGRLFAPPKRTCHDFEEDPDLSTPTYSLPLQTSSPSLFLMQLNV